MEIIKANEINWEVFEQDSLSEEKKSIVREYAKIAKSIHNLRKQLDKANKLARVIGADWAGEYLWFTKNGDAIAVFDLEDDHLKNIYNLIERKGFHSDKSDAIEKEYIKRFGFKEDKESSLEDEYKENFSYFLS